MPFSHTLALFFALSSFPSSLLFPVSLSSFDSQTSFDSYSKSDPMPALRDSRAEKIRCPGFKGTWEGARPVELSFLLCSDSSLGGLGKVLKGHFMEHEEEEPGGGG